MINYFVLFNEFKNNLVDNTLKITQYTINR